MSYPNRPAAQPEYPASIAHPMTSTPAALAAVSGLLFVMVAALVQFGAATGIDEALRLWLNRHTFPVLTFFLRVATHLGASSVWFPGMVLVVFFLVSRGRASAALLFGTTMAGSVFLRLVLKLLFHRARPSPFFGMAAPSSYSFPSGHALDTVCFYGSLALLLASSVHSRVRRTVLWGGCAVIVLVVGLSRIYLGLHYPSDVVAGYLAGLAWTAVLFIAGSRLSEPR